MSGKLLQSAGSSAQRSRRQAILAILLAGFSAAAVLSVLTIRINQATDEKMREANYIGWMAERTREYARIARAEWLYEQGNYAEAESAYRTLVKAYEETAGPEDTTTLRLLCSFVSTLRMQGKNDEAWEFASIARERAAKNLRDGNELKVLIEMRYHDISSNIAFAPNGQALTNLWPSGPRVF